MPDRTLELGFSLILEPGFSKWIERNVGELENAALDELIYLYNIVARYSTQIA